MNLLEGMKLAGIPRLVFSSTAAVYGADKAARQAKKQAQKALPSSGGMSAGNIALLGAGALLAGSGVLLYKKSAIS